MSGNKIFSQKIIISSHVFVTGPAFDLLDYFNKYKTEDVIFIHHPLYQNQQNQIFSGFERYKSGLYVTGLNSKNIQLPEILSYIKHFLLNIWYVYKTHEKWSVYIGNDNLNTLSGILLKKLGLVKQVVYYVIDYNPVRFPNRLLNYIYHIIDKICVLNADVTWNVSPRMQLARKEYFNFTGGRQIVVPIGIWYDRIVRKNINQVNIHSLIFVGQVSQKQGIQHVINAIPDIIKKIPDFKYIVIGHGEYSSFLKRQVESLGLEKYVSFMGFVSDHVQIENMISQCGLAIALYEKYDNLGQLTFTYFADPAKIKLYLGCGVPVITTDVSYNALEIKHRKCGLITNNNPDQISKIVINMMTDLKNLEKYKNNAKEYAKNFNWNKIFSEAIKSVVI